MRSWNVSYGKDGFTFRAYERRWIGVALEWLLDRDPCWWGEYHNLPFCLINPWGWTWQVGPEGHSLGDAWSTVGQWLHRFAWRLQKEREVFRVPLTDEEAQRLEPEFFADMKALEED